MKVILYEPHDIKNIHIKIIHGLYLMCKSHSIDFEISTQVERLSLPDYSILFLVNCFLELTLLPSHVKVVVGPQIQSFLENGLSGPFRNDLVGKCVFNGLSEWVLQMIQESHSLSIPTGCFPFAVDIDQFKPRGFQKDLDCIVYCKHREPAFLEKALTIIQQSGVTFQTITYTNYMEVDYMKLLDRANFMICLDAHESQGFALEEAMACDVPLLVCDVKSMYEEYYDDIQVHAQKQPKKLLATSVPYWSDQCGIRIFDLDELPKAIEMMKSTVFRPREYIVQTLSPHVCMERILKYFNI